MPLTTAQSAALKADIVANVNSLRLAKDVAGIVAYYNALLPGNLIWRSNIGVDEIKSVVVAAEYAVLGQPARDLFAVLMAGNTIDGTAANTRAQFAAIFTAALAPTTLAALNAVAQRAPTRLEWLTQSGGVSPFFGYLISSSDVEGAVFNADGSLK